MSKKIIELKINAIDLDSIKRFYSILKEFCRKNIDGYLINSIEYSIKSEIV